MKEEDWTSAYVILLPEQPATPLCMTRGKVYVVKEHRIYQHDNQTRLFITNDDGITRNFFPHRFKLATTEEILASEILQIKKEIGLT